MDKFEVYSDIASICLEIGGNFIPVSNDIGCDGKYNVFVIDTAIDKSDKKPDGKWCLKNTWQVNADNCYLYDSDCARLEGDGTMMSYFKRLHLFKQGTYEIYVDGGNFLFVRFGREL